MSAPDRNALSQQRFSRFAANYSGTDEVFFDAPEMPHLLQLADPQPGWSVLDIATGGGATALALAPHVARVIALDHAPGMLAAARARLAQQAPAVVFAGGDAEALPFPDASFDCITCRIAAHHFPQPARFVDEVARCLRPGGVFVLQDLAAPENARAAAWCDAFERLRDPSHVHMLAAYAWAGLCLNSGLHPQPSVIHRHAARLLPWAERQGCPPAVIERLQLLLLQAPPAVRAWLNICCAGSPDAGFDHVYLLLRAVRPA
jgi:ubiquinone/menaquinone biosynthesis C-methylase UbiE